MGCISISKKKILILGDAAQVQWHAVSELQDTFEMMLKDKYELTFSEDYPDLNIDMLKQYDLCVNYIDNWHNRGTRQAADVLQSYISDGGKLLTLHNGIILDTEPNLLKMHGGAFTGHEEYCELKYSSSNVQHEITKDLQPFTIGEEPYEFDLYPEVEKEIILQYELKGKLYPAAWVLHYGKGTIVYLSPGHNKNTFHNSSIQAIINSSIEWLIN